jgi:hypothetical protein
MIDDVNVRVRGREWILEEITSKPPRAVLDLTDAREGNNVLFLNPSAITVPANVQIIRISPRRISVHLGPRAAQNNNAH